MFQKTSTNLVVSKSEAAGKRAAPTVIASDVNVLGNIRSEGTLDIDGRVQGNVQCRVMTLRKGGRIEGDVIADSMQVFGEIRGTVQAREIVLHATARVEGVILHQSLTIEDGAFIDGQLKRINSTTGTNGAVLSPLRDDEMEMFRSLRLIPDAV